MDRIVRKRPNSLNLLQIRLPITGVVSILHRVSGLGLFLMLPFLIGLLELSLDSQESFERLRVLVSYPLIKLLLIGLLWAFLHHFCMGIRILLIDLHVGVDRAQARNSAKVVLAVSLPMTLILGVKLW